MRRSTRWTMPAAVLAIGGALAVVWAVASSPSGTSVASAEHYARDPSVRILHVVAPDRAGEPWIVYAWLWGGDGGRLDVDVSLDGVVQQRIKHDVGPLRVEVDAPLSSEAREPPWLELVAVNRAKRGGDASMYLSSPEL